MEPLITGNLIDTKVRSIDCCFGDDAEVEQVQSRDVCTRNGRRSPAVWRGEISTESKNQVTKHGKWKVENKLTDTLEDKSTATNGAESDGNKDGLKEIEKDEKFRKGVDQRSDYHQRLETQRD